MQWESARTCRSHDGGRQVTMMCTGALMATEHDSMLAVAITIVLSSAPDIDGQAPQRGPPRRLENGNRPRLDSAPIPGFSINSTKIASPNRTAGPECTVWGVQK